MAGADRASMLALDEVATHLGWATTRLRARLRKSGIHPRQLGNTRDLYSWEDLEANLPDTLVARLERASRIDGVRLVPLARTVAGHAHLLEQWSFRRNGSLTPWRVGPQSTRKVWWKCAVGPDHEWREAVCDRNQFRRGRLPGCPFCAGRRVSITNCLATRDKAAAREWHKRKNAPLTPRRIQAGSSRLVWWKCKRAKDHVWQERVANRVGERKLGCPFCASRRLVRSNTLAAIAPEVARQWHPKSNRSLTPRDVVAGSTRLVWWMCRRGPDHVWRQSPKARVAGHGCPFCAGKKVSVTNSLARRFPQLAAEWHPKKNRPLTPDDVVPGSAKRVYWRCRRDASHVWRASPNARTTGARRDRVRACPFCAGRRVSKDNSLASAAPDVAREWHRAKNGALTPRDVTSGTRREVWWRCARGHVWRATVKNRARKRTGCPRCDLSRRRGEIY
jgi:hypothetical protein